MPALKNIRHERFCREFIKTGEIAEAYRLVYPDANPRETAKKNGWRLMHREPYATGIRRRIEEIRQQMIKRSDITIERILADYEEAKEMAKAQAKPNELVNAATAQAKLVGLLRDRQEIGSPGDFDGIDNFEEVLAKVAEEVSPEAANALAKVFGYAKDEEPEGAAGLLDQQPPSDSVN